MASLLGGTQVAAIAAGKQLEATFLASLKSVSTVTAQEQAIITEATQTLAAAPFLMSDPDMADQVAQAKAALASIAVAHEIEGNAAVGAMIQQAVSTAIPILVTALAAA